MLFCFGSLTCKHHNENWKWANPNQVDPRQATTVGNQLGFPTVNVEKWFPFLYLERQLLYLERTAKGFLTETRTLATRSQKLSGHGGSNSLCLVDLVQGKHSQKQGRTRCEWQPSQKNPEVPLLSTKVFHVSNSQKVVGVFKMQKEQTTGNSQEASKGRKLVSYLP